MNLHPAGRGLLGKTKKNADFIPKFGDGVRFLMPYPQNSEHLKILVDIHYIAPENPQIWVNPFSFSKIFPIQFKALHLLSMNFQRSFPNQEILDDLLYGNDVQWALLVFKGQNQIVVRQVTEADIFIELLPGVLSI